MAEVFVKLFLVLFMLMICSGDPNEMIFTVESLRSDDIHIRVFNTTPYEDGAFESVHSIGKRISEIPQAEFYGCDVDYRRRRFYVSDAATSSLYVFDDVNLDVMDVKITKFHTGVTPSVHVKLAVDWITDNVYWLDQFHRWICVQPGTNRNIDRTLYTVLVEEGVDLLLALAIDPLDGYMFWSNVGKYSRIERSTLSGTERQAIVFRNLYKPLSIAVDHASSIIYWVERSNIERASYNGENRKTLVRNRLTHFFDIALYLDNIVVTDISYRKVVVFNKNTGALTKRYRKGNERYYGVSVFTEVNQPMAAENHCLTKDCDDICIGGGTSSAVCVCRIGWELQPDGRSCVERFGQYHRATLISTDTDICLYDKNSMVSNDFNSTCLKNLVSGTNDDVIRFIDVDSNSRILVYSTRYTINKVNTKGENRQTLLTTTSYITGLTLDWVDENIYWSEGSGKISVFSMASRAINTILSSGRTNPRNILVDPYVMQLYWIAGGSGNTVIEKANLDGSQRTVVVKNGVLDQPKSLVIDLHKQQLYWIDEVFIRRCSVDGTGLQFVNVDNTDPINPDRLLVYKNYLVWTKTSFTTRIYVNSKLKPSKRIASYNVPLKATDIKAMDPILQSVKGCDMFNGGCDHICLPVGNSSECQCEFGYELGANGRTCESTPLFDNFLLITDLIHNRIYQVSLDTGSIQGLRSGGSRIPTGVTFDPVRGHVIWGETDVIKKMMLNGSAERILYETGLQLGLSAKRFAIDLSSGNAYYTYRSATREFKGVSVVTPDGKHRKIIMTYTDLLDIALDQQAGVMFWTDSRFKVWKVYIDGSNREELRVKLTMPYGIAIDHAEKKLYITDFEEIHRCSYTGTCTNVYEHTHTVKTVIANIYLSGSFLYYTYTNDVYRITKIDKATFTNKVRLLNNPELEYLYGMYVYNSSEPRPPVHSICSTNDGLGPCSTFCFPRGQQDYACACEDGVNLTNDNKRCANVPSTTTTTTTTSPISETTPPVTKTWPPESETTPPVSETTPLVSETAPPVSETTPSVSETAPTIFRTTHPNFEITTTSSNNVFSVISSGGEESNKGFPLIIGVAAGNVMIIVLVIITITVMCRQNQTSKPPSNGRSPPVGTNNQSAGSTYDSIGNLIDLGVPGNGSLAPDNGTRNLECPLPEPITCPLVLNTHSSDYLVPNSMDPSSSNRLEMQSNLETSHLYNSCYDVTDYRNDPFCGGHIDREDYLNPC